MSVRKVGENRYRFECMIKGQRFSKTFHFYTETKTQIERKFVEWRIACEKHSFANTDYTLSEFSEIWIDNYIKPNCTAHVLRCYKGNLKNWILPALGNYRLDTISPLIIDRFINTLKSSKTKYSLRANDKLTNNTVYKIYENLRTMLTLAYKKGLLPNNPCDRVELRLKHNANEETHYWNVEEYKRALELLSQNKDKLKAFIVEFALKTGLRRSEMFGITWDDVDLEKKTISVNKSRQKENNVMKVCPCKTPSSIRTISMPDSIAKKLEALKKTSNTTFIFEKVDYDSMTDWYRRWVRKSGLPYIKFHDLRHTHASLLLYKGIDIKTISERLGHANISTTMNVYTHVMRELDVGASEAIEAI